jgi:hypothetical protein
MAVKRAVVGIFHDDVMGNQNRMALLTALSAVAPRAAPPW